MISNLQTGLTLGLLALGTSSCVALEAQHREDTAFSAAARAARDGDTVSAVDTYETILDSPEVADSGRAKLGLVRALAAVDPPRAAACRDDVLAEGTQAQKREASQIRVAMGPSDGVTAGQPRRRCFVPGTRTYASAARATPPREPPAFSGGWTGGKQCKRGCPCGNTCIDCSKRCRK